MPELPEVETTKRGLEPYLVQQRIESICVRQNKLRFLVPEEIQQLVGQPILRLVRRAKYLLVETPTGTALWHLGMSGSLRIVEHHCAANKHDHIDWLLSNGKILRYHDPRRFGALLFFPLNTPIQPLLHLGPEPLTAEFTAEQLWQRSRHKKQPIKTFIMDNSVVVGVGNIYANESLFLAGIRPQTAAGKLSLARLTNLVTVIKEVLAAAIQQGGTTLRDFVSAEGKPGYFAQQLFVYGRAGQPCLRCHSTLCEIRLAQRSCVYCPKCQR